MTSFRQIEANRRDARKSTGPTAVRHGLTAETVIGALTAARLTSFYPQRGDAAEAMMWTKAVMTKSGLSLNEAENFDQGRPEGMLRVPWCLVRAALLGGRIASGIGAEFYQSRLSRLSARP